MQFNSIPEDWIDGLIQWFTWFNSNERLNLGNLYIHLWSIYDVPFSKPNWFGHFGRILPQFPSHQVQVAKGWQWHGQQLGIPDFWHSLWTEVPREYFISEYKATHFSSVDDSPKKRTELFPSEVGKIHFQTSCCVILVLCCCSQGHHACGIFRSFIHGRVDQLLVIGDGHPTFIRESKPLLMGIQTLTIGLMTLPYSTIQKPHLLLQNSQSALSMSQPRSAPGKTSWLWKITQQKPMILSTHLPMSRLWPLTVSCLGSHGKSQKSPILLP